MTATDVGDRRKELAESGLLTMQEAMALLRKSRAWLYTEMTAGRLPFAVIGRRRYIPRAALTELIAQHMTAAPMV